MKHDLKRIELRQQYRTLFSASRWWDYDSAVLFRVNLQGGSKIGTIFLYASTLSNINLFSKLFYCQNQEKICNNTTLKIPTHLK